MLSRFEKSGARRAQARRRVPRDLSRFPRDPRVAMGNVQNFLGHCRWPGYALLALSISFQTSFRWVGYLDDSDHRASRHLAGGGVRFIPRNRSWMEYRAIAKRRPGPGVPVSRGRE